MNKKLVLAVVVVIIVVLGLAHACSLGDTEYEKAGKEFGSWANTDPNKWTDTQKDYFNNFTDWADKN